MEQSKGVEHPHMAGFYHHRWLVSVVDGVLEFRQKPHLLHVTSKAIVTKVGFWRDINPAHAITAHYWEGELNCHEVLDFDEQSVVEELCEYSHRAQRIPQLLVPPQVALGKRVRKAFHRLRQAWAECGLYQANSYMYSLVGIGPCAARHRVVGTELGKALAQRDQHVYLCKELVTSRTIMNESFHAGREIH
ncbi:MAG: hypothetical protein R3C56_08315 [Pirellulaceae bacterium]